MLAQAQKLIKQSEKSPYITMNPSITIQADATVFIKAHLVHTCVACMGNKYSNYFAKIYIYISVYGSRSRYD